MKSILSTLLLVALLLSAGPSLAQDTPKIHPRAISVVQRLLIGPWHPGSSDKVCYFTSAGTKFFVINESNRASSLTFDREGKLTAKDWDSGITGQLTDDNTILWSNKTVWTRATSLSR